MRSFALLLFTSLALISSEQTKACTGHCVVRAFNSLAVGLEGIAATHRLQVITLNEIGRSLSQHNEAQLTGYTALTDTLIEISRSEINEAHLLAEKVATLEVKRSINDKFGAVDETLCQAADIDGVISGTNTINNLKDLGTQFSNDVGASIRGVGSKITMTELFDPDEADEERVIDDKDALHDPFDSDPNKLVRNWFGGRILEKNANPAYSLIIKSIIETNWFPAPSSVVNTSADTRYKTLFNERRMRLNLATNMAHDFVSQRQFVITAESNTQFYNNFLERAGALFAPGFMSDALAVKALGLSEFGSLDNHVKSGLSGDELHRKLLFQLSANNLLRAKLQRETSKVAALRSVIAATTIERSSKSDILEALY